MNAAVANPVFLSIKAALGAALAVLACGAFGIPDVLSAAFVAVLSVSPTVVTGIRRASEQLLASALAGLLAAFCVLLGVPLAAQAGLSVLVCIGAAFALGLGSSYAAAAFSALYVVLIPRGTPGDTVEIRLLAVLLGAACALLVNAIITAPFYARVFERRLARTRDGFARAVDGTAAHGNASIRSWELQAALVREELRHAASEPHLRRGHTARVLAAFNVELDHLQRAAALMRALCILEPAARPRLAALLHANEVPADIPPACAPLVVALQGAWREARAAAQ